ncbi:RecA-family ATPase [Desulfopila aestuarii DSM 18488]|uniref:RecA-family ATPase n=2 Tax=Desulfopila aestuarii TaxID=231440 RepID=A0A1M7YFP5_9BACT|nr:RecA-family ATPase [Desulfopila aestuarii DSM 18488]
MTDLHGTAKKYLRAGLSVIPVEMPSKKARIAWKQYQTDPMPEDQVESSFNGAEALAVITGFNHVEVLDIDARSVGEPFLDALREKMPELASRLTVQATVNGGGHLVYRCPSVKIPGSQKLAFKVIEVSGPGRYVHGNDGRTIEGSGPHSQEARQGSDGKWYGSFCTLESRGDRGYFVVSPTPGYTVIQGSLTKMAEVSAEERDFMLDLARSFDESGKLTAQDVPKQAASDKWEPPMTNRPGDRLNREATAETALAWLVMVGWQLHHADDGFYYVTRPGKSVQEGYSATIRRENGLFHVFSSSVLEFGQEQSYPPFEVYTRLFAAGNHSAAAKTLVGAADTPRQTAPIEKGKLFRTAQDLRQNPPQPRYLAHAIEAGTITVMFGDPASFKSFLALDLSVSIAAGLDFAGKPTDQGPVIYQAGEGFGGLARRIEATCKSKGIPADADIPLLVSTTPVMLDDPTAVEGLIAEIREACPSDPVLLVADTMAASMSGDENSSKDTGALLTNLRRIREEIGCAVLLIHHSGLADKSRFRGSSALAGGVDAIFRVTRQDMTVTLHRPLKMKDGTPPADAHFTAESMVVGFGEDEQPITSLALRYAPHRQPGRPAVKADKKSALLRALADGMTVLAASQEIEGLTKTTAYRLASELVADGLIDTDHKPTKAGRREIEWI